MPLELKPLLHENLACRPERARTYFLGVGTEILDCSRSVPPEEAIVEPHFAAFHHVQQQQHGERFRDRSDLEQRVTIERTAASAIRDAIRHDPSSLGTDDADDDADGLVGVVDPLGEDAMNLGIRRHGVRGLTDRPRRDSRSAWPGRGDCERHDRQSKSRLNR
jgi:hypothetical protein